MTITRNFTGFVVGQAAAETILNQIREAYHGQPVWLPVVQPINATEAVLCFDQELMQLPIQADLSLSQIPMTEQLVASLGGWGALQTRAVEFPSVPPFPFTK